MEMIGQIKYIDKMGRLVIPNDLRRFCEITEQTPVEICMTSEGILIRPLEYEIVRKNCIQRSKV
ncbi:MAG: hypothetical protein IJ279_02065 [Clostridia bacterium]|nr:hypothetical protein [Clostridia bacterium]